MESNTFCDVAACQKANDFNMGGCWVMILRQQIQDLLTWVASHKRLKDYCPLWLIHLSRRFRICIWRYGGGYENVVAEDKRLGRKIVHVLHIGKTGGTAIRNALDNCNCVNDYRILTLPHPFTLKHVPRGEKVVCFLRDPASRFVSAFSNAVLKGYPTYVRDYTKKEERIFSRFPKPNDLAEGLCEKNGIVKHEAKTAMRSIEHLNTHYSYWLHDVEYLASRKNDILFIGFQETLNDDFNALIGLLGLSDSIQLPTDPAKTNRTSGIIDSHLSDIASKNLEIWYAEDYEILDECRKIAKEINE